MRYACRTGNSWRIEALSSASIYLDSVSNASTYTTVGGLHMNTSVIKRSLVEKEATFYHFKFTLFATSCVINK